MFQEISNGNPDVDVCFKRSLQPSVQKLLQVHLRLGGGRWRRRWRWVFRWRRWVFRWRRWPFRISPPGTNTLQLHSGWVLQAQPRTADALQVVLAFFSRGVPSRLQVVLAFFSRSSSLFLKHLLHGERHACRVSSCRTKKGYRSAEGSNKKRLQTISGSDNECFREKAALTVGGSPLR